MRVSLTEKGRLLVAGPFNHAGLFEYLVKNLDGARTLRAPSLSLSMPATTHNARVLDDAPVDVEWTCARPAAPLRPDAALTLDGYAFKTTPYDHQRDVFAATKDAPAYALYWEMGTGKTKAIIDTAASLFMRKRITLLVVVAPNGVHAQWIRESDDDPGEMQKHCPVPWVGFANGRGFWAARRLNALKDALHDHSRLCVVAVNTEACSTERGASIIKRAMLGRNALLVLDESHSIKSPSAQRTRRLTKLAPLAKYRRIMSGTPITKGQEDLFAQYRFLDPNIIGCQTFAAFVGTYCIKGGYEGREIIGYRNLGTLNRLLQPYTSRVEKSQCLDLPPKVYMTRDVPLSGEQLVAYDRGVEVLRQALDDPAYPIKNALEGLLRLRQLVGGHMPDGTPLPAPRFETVLDIVQQCEGRVVVWAVYQPEIARLEATLSGNGFPVLRYDGTTTADERAEALRRYATEPRCVLVANPAAGGTGLNLDGASVVVYYSHTFNAAHRWQSEDRTHRATTRATVTYIDLVAPGTVERKIVAALRRKRSVADMTLQELRALLF